MRTAAAAALLAALACLAPAAEPRTTKGGMTLFQGDIMFRNGTSIHDRNAMRNRLGRWPEGEIYYTLDDSYSADERQTILSAMGAFEDETCLRWTERTDQDDYVEIESDMGCWSELGRQGGAQSLSLEAPLCLKRGVVLHELMHAAGFLHEMSRPDRDDHVRVLWDNVARGMEDNFAKLTVMEIDCLGLEYDLESVMHYTAWSFAADPALPTLEPLRPDVDLSSLGRGQKEGLFTPLDVQKTRAFYECP